MKKEAKHDEKLVKKASKEFEKTEKAERKAEKVRAGARTTEIPTITNSSLVCVCQEHEKSLKKHEKLETKEHKLADKLHSASHRHDEALSKEQIAARVSSPYTLSQCCSVRLISSRQ